jgi:hypothetical protein
MPSRSGEDVDLPVVSPAAERVRVDAEQSAGFTEREPVAALAGSGLCRNTVNLGETHNDHPAAVIKVARNASFPSANVQPSSQSQIGGKP